ncbi:MAG: RNA polymerase sigma factor [Acidimicrobiales bacterium]
MTTRPSEDSNDATNGWFQRLFDEGYTPLIAYARRRTADANDADDIVAEVFAVAWRRRTERLADNTSPSAELPWLYGIAANVLRNHRRSQGRRLRLVERLESQPAPGQLDPSQLTETTLRDALEQLPFDDRELLRLIAWEGLSHAEIGVVLGISTNAVGIRAHRARKKLEAELTDTHPSRSEEGTT